MTPKPNTPALEIMAFSAAVQEARWQLSAGQNTEAAPGPYLNEAWSLRSRREECLPQHC